MLAALRAEYATDVQRPGLHLSSLIYCLTKAYWNKLDPEPPSEEAVNMWSIGYALERVMIARMHVEPIVLDGIHMSPDFVLAGTLADLKSTRMQPVKSDGCAVCGLPWRGHKDMGHSYEATSRPFDMPIGWQRQFAAYLRALNLIHGESTHDFAVVVMHLVPAVLTTWRVWFTDTELEDNWQWVLQRANDFENMLAAQTSEPFEHRGFEDECTHCDYLLRCQLTASLAKESKE